MSEQPPSHNCPEHAEPPDSPSVDPFAEMIEVPHVCQICGRVIIAQYDFARLQDSETGEIL